MADKQIIATENAPAAIGTYSQAVRVGDTVYISGQIPLHPATMEVCSQDFAAQAEQCFANLKAVAEAAGGSMADIVKVSIFMTDLSNFPTVNEVMSQYFDQPYPARAAVGVKELPKAVQVEVEAIMVTPSAACC
ncbi:MAG TPA: reactive intermediate/imine deaminase [Oceanospirillaceae bacterium]|nr:reactive intermediate/imine deaminase [Oceanospirillaceae bacterium]